MSPYIHNRAISPLFFNLIVRTIAMDTPEIAVSPSALLTGTLRRANHVISAASHGGATVLMDVSHSVYYTLNEVGSHIWGLLSNGTTLTDIIDHLCQEYDVPRETVRNDTNRILTELFDAKLIRIE